MSKKAIMDAKEFSKALDQVCKILRKMAIPILEEVCVRFADGRCTLTATDMETWLTKELPAQGDAFSFVFHHTKDIAKACRHFTGDLVIEVSERDAEEHRLRLYIRCGGRTAEFDAWTVGDYPVQPKVEEQMTFQTNAAALLARVERVRYAVRKPSPDGYRRDLCCIQFEKDRIFSLDSCRAACDTDASLVVPLPFMVDSTALVHLNQFGDQEVHICIGARYVQITDKATSLYIYRVEAPPFDMGSAVPKKFVEEICVSPREFLQELAYLKEFTQKAYRPVVRFQGGKLSMSVPNGMFTTHVAAEGKSEIVFGFDLRYMTDALRQFKGEDRIRMKISGARGPIILEADGRGDFALVLPVRLKREEAAA